MKEDVEMTMLTSSISELTHCCVPQLGLTQGFVCAAAGVAS